MTVCRLIILALGGMSVLAGAVIFAAPQAFYEAVPGLDLMGPFNGHFVRDVGLAYLAGGIVLIAGGLLADRRLALAGALWFCLHALFHIQIWMHRGWPIDDIFRFDLLAVIAPGSLALWASLKFPPTGTGQCA